MSFLGGGESLNLSLSRVEEGWGNPIWGLEINLHGRKASILPIRLKGGGREISISSILGWGVSNLGLRNQSQGAESLNLV